VAERQVQEARAFRVEIRLNARFNTTTIPRFAGAWEPELVGRARPIGRLIASVRMARLDGHPFGPTNAGSAMRPIAEIAFDLAHTPDKMAVRLYAPEPVPESEEWACRFEIDEPLALRRTVYGVCSFQALVLALKSLSANLYGSDYYLKGELGLDGEFGGNLSIPAPQIFLDRAPYPF
jgi:hypothetical protein